MNDNERLTEEFIEGLYAAKFFLSGYEALMSSIQPDDEFLKLKVNLDNCQAILRRTINYFKCNTAIIRSPNDSKDK